MKIHSKDKELEAAATREAQNSVNDQEMADRYVSTMLHTSSLSEGESTS